MMNFVFKMMHLMQTSRLRRDRDDTARRLTDAVDLGTRHARLDTNRPSCGEAGLFVTETSMR